MDNVKLRIIDLDSKRVWFFLEKDDWQHTFVFVLSDARVWKIKRCDKENMDDLYSIELLDYIALYVFRDWKNKDGLTRKDLTFCFYTNVCDILDNFLTKQLEINVTSFLENMSKEIK